jgi:mono/diheme cytochrome c family protein
MDCARCHGRDFAGWAAPSLLAAVREGSRERFDYFVLEGDAMRGMPGYRSQPRVTQDLDAIYAYLRACAAPPRHRCPPLAAMLKQSTPRQQRSPP